MRRSFKQVKAWSLMASVAVAAIVLAAVRIDSAPAAGIAIIASCAGYLGYRRYAEGRARSEATGRTIGRSQKARLLLASVTLAVLLIGLSDLSFLVGYYGFLKLVYETVVESHWTPYSDPSYMGVGAIIGAMLAVLVGSSLRSTIWSREWIASRGHRRWLRLWPVVLAAFIGLALGAVEMWERWRFCTMMATYHANQEKGARDGKRAALHSGLKEWYRYTTWRPWLPVHPEQAPREP